MSARTLRRLAALLLFASAAPALAVDIHVDAAAGSDANDGLTWATAKATVSAGVALAVTLPGPDAVRVAEGRYLGQVVMPAETSLIGGYASGGLVRDVLRRPTILDGAGVGPVVSFGTGTDASMLDGFVVTGGRTSDPQQGGGITVKNASATISTCIIERNTACAGAGIQVRDALYPLIVDVIVRENTILCDLGEFNGGAVALFGCGSSPSPRTMLRELVITANRPPVSDRACGGLSVVQSQCLAENVLISGNGGSGLMNADFLQCANCAIANQATWAILRRCDTSMATFWTSHATLAECLAGGLRAEQAATTRLWGAMNFDFSRSVFGAGQIFPTQIELDDICYAFGEYFCQTPSSLAPFVATGICGPFQAGEPAFVSGPGGNIYLSHVATGRPADSPAVDADAQPASDFGLDVRTTRTDHVPDSGALDWGYHFEVSPTLWTATDFRVLRGSDPRALPVHVTGIASLPWTDAPGVLSDPALPLLFYCVEWPLNRILVTKDAGTDSVRLAF